MTYEINSRVITSLTLHCDSADCGRDGDLTPTKVTLDVTDHGLTADPLDVFTSAIVLLAGYDWHAVVSMRTHDVKVKFYCSDACLARDFAPIAPEPPAPVFAWRPGFVSSRSAIDIRWIAKTTDDKRHLFINGSRTAACSDDLPLSSEWVGVTQSTVDKWFPEKCPACAGVSNTFIPRPTPSQED